MRSLFIFRQDLRIHDNHWLWQTVQSSQEVFPVFIFDTRVLSKFAPDDPRLDFVKAALAQLDQDLQSVGSYLTVLHGDSVALTQQLATELKVDTISRNRSYGSGSLTRDKTLTQRAAEQGIQTKIYSDYLLVEPEEVIPMKVFTPFKKRWLKELATKEYSKPYIIDKIVTPAHQLTNSPTLLKTGQSYQLAELRPIKLWSERLQKDYTHYDDTRNIPSIDGTTRLSPYTRFGLVSIREVYRNLSTNSPTNQIPNSLISELARREYRQHIAHHFPESRELEFQEKRRHIPRDNNEVLFKARCEGRTGYPMVDAGMRQLVQEKRMHNRVRMIVASFLTKDLLIDRRWGEQFFAQHLLDFDENVNINNRQRSASVGADPKPIRIFSPMLQSQRFDPNCTYIKNYIPELQNIHPDKIHDPLKYDLSAYGYPRPIIDHYIWSKKAKEIYKS